MQLPTTAKTECPGFTLVEILLAVTVLGALTTIAMPRFQSYRLRAEIATATADIKNIELSIQIYKQQNDVLPVSLAALGIPIPADPWGTAYQYLKLEGASAAQKAMARKDLFLVPINNDFDLYSMGADRLSVAPLSAKQSQDDIIRANDGRYVNLAANY